MGASENTTLGSPVTATSNLVAIGSVQAPRLKFPWNTANDNVVIQSSMGSEVARFCNDYRCRLNGNTAILGNASVSGELYSAGPVACNQTMNVVEDANIEGAR